jgi:ribosomal protein S10
MKNFLLVVLFTALSVVINTGVFAEEWDRCKTCHDGTIAPSKAELVSRFKTAAFFVKAAQDKDTPMMGPLKLPKNEPILYAVAEELGLPVEWNRCKTCHQDDGIPAPGREQLKKKFKTAAEFVKAAKNTKSPLMSPIKLSKNDEILYRVATELGLK